MRRSLTALKGDTYIVVNIIGQIDKKRKQQMGNSSKYLGIVNESFKVRSIRTTSPKSLIDWNARFHRSILAN